MDNNSIKNINTKDTLSQFVKLTLGVLMLLRIVKLSLDLKKELKKPKEKL